MHSFIVNPIVYFAVQTVLRLLCFVMFCFSMPIIIIFGAMILAAIGVHGVIEDNYDVKMRAEKQARRVQTK